MSKELLARAEKLRALYKEWETRPQVQGTRGFGHHPEDTDPSQEDPRIPKQMRRKVAPIHNGLPAASTHVVAFYDHDDMEQVHFVGPDAEKAYSACQSWLKKHSDFKKLHNAPGSIRKLAMKVIPELKLDEVDGLPRLTVWLCDWNDVSGAIEQEGVGISGAPLVHDGEETTP